MQMTSHIVPVYSLRDGESEGKRITTPQNIISLLACIVCGLTSIWGYINIFVPAANAGRFVSTGNIAGISVIACAAVLWKMGPVLYNLTQTAFGFSQRFRQIMRSPPCPLLELSEINKICSRQLDGQLDEKALNLIPRSDSCDEIKDAHDSDQQITCRELCRQALIDCIDKNGQNADNADADGLEFTREFEAKVHLFSMDLCAAQYPVELSGQQGPKCLRKLCDPTKPFGYRNCRKKFCKHNEDCGPNFEYTYNDSQGAGHPTLMQLKENSTDTYYMTREDEKNDKRTQIHMGDKIYHGYNFYIGFPSYRPVDSCHTDWLNRDVDSRLRLNKETFVDFFTQAYLEFGRPCFNDDMLNPIRRQAFGMLDD